MSKKGVINTTETVVSDEIIVHFPKPSPDVQKLIDKVPNTRLVLYYREMHCGINKEWKAWAFDMMEAGYLQPSIVQLAGEDLTINPFEFNDLVESIFKELKIQSSQDVGKYQYSLWVAHQVVEGKMSAEKGFAILSQAAIDTNYHDAFIHYYYLEENADLLRIHQQGCYGDGNMREDNIEEWMTLYFKKTIIANS